MNYTCQTSRNPRTPTGSAIASFLQPLADGWRREVVYRSNPQSRADIYYYTPDRVKLRSRVEIRNYLTSQNLWDKYNVNQFSYMGGPIGGLCTPFEIVRRARPKNPQVELSTTPSSRVHPSTTDNLDSKLNLPNSANNDQKECKTTKRKRKTVPVKNPGTTQRHLRSNKEVGNHDCPSPVGIPVKCKVEIDDAITVDSSSSEENTIKWMYAPPEPVQGPLFNAEAYYKLLSCGNHFKGLEIVTARNFANIGKTNVVIKQEEGCGTSNSSSNINEKHLNPIYMKRIKKEEDDGTSISCAKIDETLRLSKAKVKQEEAGIPGINEANVSKMCVCSRGETKDMITCSNLNCIFQKYHVTCVNISNHPRGLKWYCPICQGSTSCEMLESYVALEP